MSDGVNVAVTVADPAPATVAVEPETDTTDESDDEYPNDPATDAVGAEIVYGASPYVLDTSPHDNVGVALPIVTDDEVTVP